MITIRTETQINAPIERVFDLARSIDFHCHSTSQTSERAIAGRTCGLIELGEEVTWRARHFGITQHLTVRITVFNRPNHFRDEMVRGAFKSMCHDHHFASQPDGSTIMSDVFSFEAPFGFLGRLVERWVLKNYLSRFLIKRNHEIKRAAESEQWREFLS